MGLHVLRNTGYRRDAHMLQAFGLGSSHSLTTNEKQRPHSQRLADAPEPIGQMARYLYRGASPRRNGSDKSEAFLRKNDLDFKNVHPTIFFVNVL